MGLWEGLPVVDLRVSDAVTEEFAADIGQEIVWVVDVEPVLREVQREGARVGKRGQGADLVQVRCLRANCKQAIDPRYLVKYEQIEARHAAQTVTDKCDGVPRGILNHVAYQPPQAFAVHLVAQHVA
jgi:hypothetical protein